MNLSGISDSYREKINSTARLAIQEALAKDCSEFGVREALRVRRESLLKERYATLSRWQSAFLSVIDCQVDWNSVVPILKWVETEREKNIWFYARNIVSSAPDDPVVGRRMLFYVCDERTGRWLGIVRLVSPMNVISPRERYVGWKNETKWKRLNNVLNIQTCVPIQPFGTLCGGKLLALLCLSNEVREKYKLIYGDDLVAIETTSLFGKSSQYNRLPEFAHLGNTLGSTNTHIDKETWNSVRQWLVLNPERDVAGKHAAKLRSVVHAARGLGVKSEGKDASYAKHFRGFYWGELATNAVEVLNDVEFSVISDFIDRPTDMIIKKWLDRWYFMRLGKFFEEVNTFASDQYRLINNVDIGVSQTEMF